MKKTFYEKVLRSIRRFSMLQGHQKIAIAVSGGPDSTALLSFLAALREKMMLRLFCIHVNHCLRGTESERDARLVAEYSVSLGIPVRILNCNAAEYASRRGVSIEHAGREVRYRLLRKHAEELGATRVATAHHLDDQAETVLMRVIRGAGISGISGIHPVMGGLFIRPFIEVTRQEIMEYVGEHRIPHAIDSTNEQCCYFRNSVRHRLMPLVQEYNPSVRERLWSLSQILHDDDALLHEISDSYYRRCCRTGSESVQIDVRAASGLPVSLKRRLVRKALESLQGDLLEIGFEHVEKIVGMMESHVGIRTALPGGLRAERGYGEIAISKCAADPSAASFQPEEIVLEVPGRTFAEGWNMTVAADIEAVKGITPAFPASRWEVALDADKMEMPLSVRARRDGDRFSPLGVKGTKKVKDFFIEVKIEQGKRDHIPLVVDGKGRIVWIAGYRIDERFKVTDETKNLLRLKVEKPV